MAFFSRGSTGAIPRLSCGRPALEALEDRMVLSPLASIAPPAIGSQVMIASVQTPGPRMTVIGPAAELPTDRSAVYSFASNVDRILTGGSAHDHEAVRSVFPSDHDGDNEPSTGATPAFRFALAIARENAGDHREAAHGDHDPFVGFREERMLQASSAIAITPLATPGAGSHKAPVLSPGAAEIGINAVPIFSDSLHREAVAAEFLFGPASYGVDSSPELVADSAPTTGHVPTADDPGAALAATGVLPPSDLRGLGLVVDLLPFDAVALETGLRQFLDQVASGTEQWLAEATPLGLTPWVCATACGTVACGTAAFTLVRGRTSPTGAEALPSLSETWRSTGMRHHPGSGHA
jgi:hypothetical protein